MVSALAVSFSPWPQASTAVEDYSSEPQLRDPVKGGENAICMLRLVGLRKCLVVMQSFVMHAILSFCSNVNETKQKQTNGKQTFF